MVKAESVFDDVSCKLQDGSTPRSVVSDTSTLDSFGSGTVLHEAAAKTSGLRQSSENGEFASRLKRFVPLFDDSWEKRPSPKYALPPGWGKQCSCCRCLGEQLQEELRNAAHSKSEWGRNCSCSRCLQTELLADLQKRA
mmetsp:Transcript_45202/g.71466  ORF Transcript_45202/g.71466 Transcript_45202/m.71466 type:complete len:139 (+) Transcript_45202:101-517(+)|eukprot:CAMPEP_0169079976 /NCGR_PEP_ID=MMETSP1015-20121227/10235_1 /TAXON_ID=342587 /ORGANISM="Karlodinium micrum, Strain CCMP2283" /LENGTH=138 /DNA_ID=CAMNT_0009139675 /DNA_START=45 /DNA_END=461 /DNA_ORIENTATION=-